MARPAARLRSRPDEPPLPADVQGRRARITRAARTSAASSGAGASSSRRRSSRRSRRPSPSFRRERRRARRRSPPVREATSRPRARARAHRRVPRARARRAHLRRRDVGVPAPQRRASASEAALADAAGRTDDARAALQQVSDEFRRPCAARAARTRARSTRSARARARPARARRSTRVRRVPLARSSRQWCTAELARSRSRPPPPPSPLWRRESGRRRRSRRAPWRRRPPTNAAGPADARPHAVPGRARATCSSTSCAGSTAGSARSCRSCARSRRGAPSQSQARGLELDGTDRAGFDDAERALFSRARAIAPAIGSHASPSRGRRPRSVRRARARRQTPFPHDNDAPKTRTPAAFALLCAESRVGATLPPRPQPAPRVLTRRRAARRRAGRSRRLSAGADPELAFAARRPPWRAAARAYSRIAPGPNGWSFLRLRTCWSRSHAASRLRCFSSDSACAASRTAPSPC